MVLGEKNTGEHWRGGQTNAECNYVMCVILMAVQRARVVNVEMYQDTCFRDSRKPDITTGIVHAYEIREHLVLCEFSTLRVFHVIRHTDVSTIQFTYIFSYDF